MSFCLCIQPFGSGFPHPDISLRVYLSCKDAADSNDDQDIKDGRSHYRPHPHVPFSDEYPWETKKTRKPGQISWQVKNKNLNINMKCVSSKVPWEGDHLTLLRPNQDGDCRPDGTITWQ